MKFLSAFALCILATAAHAEFKANILPKEQEAKWVAAVQALKTRDGSTIGETLAFVTKMRATQFKVKEISPGYGQDGNAHGMNVCYWIGEKRLKGDEYCNTGFRLNVDGAAIVATPDDDDGTNALMGGRDAWLRYVDDGYTTDCIDPETHRKMC